MDLWWGYVERGGGVDSERLTGRTVYKKLREILQYNGAHTLPNMYM